MASGMSRIKKKRGSRYTVPVPSPPHGTTSLSRGGKEVFPECSLAKLDDERRRLLARIRFTTAT